MALKGHNPVLRATLNKTLAIYKSRHKALSSRPDVVCCAVSLSQYSVISSLSFNPYSVFLRLLRHRGEWSVPPLDNVIIIPSPLGVHKSVNIDEEHIVGGFCGDRKCEVDGLYGCKHQHVAKSKSYIKQNSRNTEPSEIGYI